MNKNNSDIQDEKWGWEKLLQGCRLEDWWTGYYHKIKTISYKQREFWETNNSFSWASFYFSLNQMDYFFIMCMLYFQIPCPNQKEEGQKGARIRSLISFFKCFNMFHIQDFEYIISSPTRKFLNVRNNKTMIFKETLICTN